MNKELILLNNYVNQSAERYINFMNIEELPQFRIAEKKISLLDATKRGFGSLASHHYDISTGTHTLNVWSDIYQRIILAQLCINQLGCCRLVRKL